MVQKHHHIWKHYLDEGMKVTTISNLFINFLCESANYCSDAGVRKHKIPLEYLLQVSTILLNTTLKQLNDALKSSSGDFDMPDEALITVACILRFYCYFRPYLPRYDLSKII
jgi:hypothetical protein